MSKKLFPDFRVASDDRRVEEKKWVNFRNRFRFAVRTTNVLLDCAAYEHLMKYLFSLFPLRFSSSVTEQRLARVSISQEKLHRTCCYLSTDYPRTSMYKHFFPLLTLFVQCFYYHTTGDPSPERKTKKKWMEL